MRIKGHGSECDQKNSSSFDGVASPCLESIGPPLLHIYSEKPKFLPQSFFKGRNLEEQYQMFYVRRILDYRHAVCLGVRGQRDQQ